MLAGNCAAQLLTLPLFALPPLTTYLLIYCEINREWRLPYFHYRDLHRNRLRPSIPVLEDFIFVSTNHGQVWFRSHPSPQNFRSILTRPNEIYFHPHSIPFCKAIVRSFILYCRPSALRPRSGKKKEEKRRKKAERRKKKKEEGRKKKEERRSKKKKDGVTKKKKRRKKTEEERRGKKKEERRTKKKEDRR